jgi:hypothetical protein
VSIKHKGSEQEAMESDDGKGEDPENDTEQSRVFAEEEEDEDDCMESDEDARSKDSERSGETEISADEEDIPPGIAPTALTTVRGPKHATSHWPCIAFDYKWNCMHIWDSARVPQLSMATKVVCRIGT